MQQSPNIEVVVRQESSRVRYFTKLLLICIAIGVVLSLLYIYYAESFQGLKGRYKTDSPTNSRLSLEERIFKFEKNAKNQSSRTATNRLQESTNSESSSNDAMNSLQRNFFKKSFKADSTFTTDATTHTLPFTTELLTEPDSSESVEQLTRKVYGATNCPDNPRRKDLTRIMQSWAEIAKKHNIEYMIFYGSLLGSIRNREVTPYDHDIDIMVNESYYPLLTKIAPKRGFDNGDGQVRLVVQPDFANKKNPDHRKRLNCRGESVPNMADWCSFQEPMARVITGSRFMDISQFTDNGPNIVDVVDKVYAKNDLYPLKPCWLNGVQTFCPRNPKKLLKIYFKSEDLSPPYMCRDGQWKDRMGNVASQLG